MSKIQVLLKSAMKVRIMIKWQTYFKNAKIRIGIILRFTNGIHIGESITDKLVIIVESAGRLIVPGSVDIVEFRDKVLEVFIELTFLQQGKTLSSSLLNLEPTIQYKTSFIA